MKESIIHQENINAEILKNNRKGSSIKHTSHMNIRFLINNRIDAGYICAEICPSDEMMGDLYT